MAKPKTFHPSPVSISPGDQARATLRYLCKAAEAVEQHLADQEEVPAWVQDQITAAAVALGMAVTYMKRTKAGTTKEQE